ncbi:class I SAM-dependent methyltransferase [Halomicrococcus sp. NG-SE-24]|uniref:class I SAM-dependent methyltransferase n=1 Tax=Halomicrococcus sp. NG-SE-24 TaxID=3436928 RepID=UPI003D9968F8
MTSWDDRFRDGNYPQDPDPSPVLHRYIEMFPEGRALDIATGTGRNAVFLAEQGYTVDAIDQSREGLRIARQNASQRSVEENCTWIQADATEFGYPENEYDAITISYFRTLDRLPDIKAALKPNGVLFYQHHLRSTEPADIGPSTDRYRFASNELLHACLDLTVLYYEEGTETVDDRTAARALIVARNSTGGKQTYPTLPRPAEQ